MSWLLDGTKGKSLAVSTISSHGSLAWLEAGAVAGHKLVGMVVIMQESSALVDMHYLPRSIESFVVHLETIWACDIAKGVLQRSR